MLCTIGKQANKKTQKQYPSLLQYHFFCFLLFLFWLNGQISAPTATTGSGISSELVIRPTANDHGSVYRCHVLHPALDKPYEVSFTLQVLCKSIFCLYLDCHSNNKRHTLLLTQSSEDWHLYFVPSTGMQRIDLV